MFFILKYETINELNYKLDDEDWKGKFIIYINYFLLIFFIFINNYL